MAAGTIQIAPYTTSNAQNSFLLQTDGFVSGTFLDNPATRYTLEGGVVGSSQSTPLWGGLPVTLEVPAVGSGGASSGLGSTIIAATAESNLDAFLVFNQASAGPITPSSNAPLYAAGMSANFVRTGSGLWLVLPVNPTAVATIAGGGSNTAIYWDYTNNRVDVSGSGALGFQIIAVNQNSKVASYNSGTGALTWTQPGSVIVVRV